MNVLQFIASIVESVAWPATAVIAFLLLRKRLPEIFPFIERLKYKGIEIEFRKSIHKLAKTSRSALPIPGMDEESAAQRTRLYELAEASPRSAILESWLQVEAAGIDALKARDAPTQQKSYVVGPRKLGELLNRAEIINGKQLEIFYRLRELRNKAVHLRDATFKLSEVIEYIDLASALASQIRRGVYRG